MFAQHRNYLYDSLEFTNHVFFYRWLWKHILLALKFANCSFLRRYNSPIIESDADFLKRVNDLRENLEIFWVRTLDEGDFEKWEGTVKNWGHNSSKNLNLGWLWETMVKIKDFEKSGWGRACAPMPYIPSAHGFVSLVSSTRGFASVALLCGTCVCRGGTWTRVHYMLISSLAERHLQEALGFTFSPFLW